MRVGVEYTTSPPPESGAVQWLDPPQTAGKQHPYLFTQCQVCHLVYYVLMETPSPSLAHTCSQHAALPGLTLSQDHLHC